jgi:hypothetical protein
MGKVYGIHVLKFKAGANTEEYERFYRDRVASMRIPGMQAHLLRADRGSDVGTYVELLEFDGTEARDRLFPVADQLPPELEEQLGPVMEQSARWLESIPGVYTDWVTIV